MKYLAQNIRFLRNRDGLSQGDLAAKVGRKSFTTIQHWEKGDADPPARILEKLCDVFSVGLDDLLYSDLRMSQAGTPASGVRIPVLGRISAGIPSEAITDVIDYEDIPAELARSGEFFGLKICGDSMSPLLPDGCVVIFRQQTVAETGDIVAALIDGLDGVCKKYKVYDIGFALVPINEAYKPLFFASQEADRVAIVGKAVEMRRRL